MGGKKKEFVGFWGRTLARGLEELSGPAHQPTTLRASRILGFRGLGFGFRV